MPTARKPGARGGEPHLSMAPARLAELHPIASFSQAASGVPVAGFDNESGKIRAGWIPVNVPGRVRAHPLDAWDAFPNPVIQGYGRQIPRLLPEPTKLQG